MSLLSDLIAKHPELSAIKDDLLFIDRKFSTMEAENKKLRDEIAFLKAAQANQEFVEASGVLWKSKKTGGRESVPYCPTCKSMLADYSGSLLCLKCNWQAPLKSFEVPKVYHDLFGDK